MIRFLVFLLTYSLLTSFIYCFMPKSVVTVIGVEPFEDAKNLIFDLEHVKHNRTTAVLNGMIDVKDWPEDTAITLTMDKETNNGYVETGALRVEDQILCDVMKSDTFLMPDIRKCSTLPEECPINQGVYSLTNYRPDESSFPPNLLPGNFRMKFNFHRHGDPSENYGGFLMYFNIRN